MDKDFLCKCGHSKKLHEAPKWFKRATNSWIPFACYYKCINRSKFVWYCACDKYVPDNLKYLEKVLARKERYVRKKI